MLNPSFELRAASHELVTRLTGAMKLMARGPWLAASCLLFLAPSLAQDSLNVRKLGQWSDASLPPSSLYNNAYNAVWGHAQDGREYGIIGSTMGTHIIDVTDAGTPVQVAFVPGAVQGGLVVHREFKTYRKLLYAVTDEGPGTLQIIDLQYLPDSVVKVYDSNALFYRAHTLWVDTANARLYTHAGSTDFSVYSLADPQAPSLLLEPQTSIPWWNAVGPVHDGYVVGNVAYLNDMDAMHIVDLSDASAPVLLGSLTTYPQPGYNHSGWLHDNGQLYVMADETHGTDLKLFDVSDPTDIHFIDTIGLDRGPGSIPHNPVFQGDLLHVAWYYDGYALWSVADPANAQLLGYYDTHPEPYTFNYKGAWGVYPFLPSGHVLVSDMQRGLFVLDISMAVGTAEIIPPNGRTRAWPNPATDVVHIELPQAAPGPLMAELRDAAGRLERMMALSGSGTVRTVDLSGLPSGMHLLRIDDGRYHWMTRVMKTFAP